MHYTLYEKFTRSHWGEGGVEFVVTLLPLYLHHGVVMTDNHSRYC